MMSSLQLACFAAARAGSKHSTQHGTLTPEMANLASKLPVVLEKSRAKRTVSKYQAVFRKWESWAHAQGVLALPAQPEHVSLYLVKLLQSASTASPISAASCAIAWVHDISGMPNPCMASQVRNVVQAACRILAKPKQRKLPLSKSLLLTIAGHLRKQDSLQNLQLLTIFTVG